MMIIKNNQALEIKIEQDALSCHFFHEFVEISGLERINDGTWLLIKSPDKKRFSADDLKSDYRVYEMMNELAYSAVNCMDLNEEEAAILSQEMDENNGYTFEIARKGLLSLSFKDWMDNLAGEKGGYDWKEAMAEFSHIARGNDYTEYAAIYIQGVSDDEAASIVNEFKTYAYHPRLWYEVTLIDCLTGDAISDDSLGGIYDDSFDLSYMKELLKETIDSMPYIDKGLKQEAFGEIEKLDYSSIEW